MEQQCLCFFLLLYEHKGAFSCYTADISLKRCWRSKTELKKREYWTQGCDTPSQQSAAGKMLDCQEASVGLVFALCPTLLAPVEHTVGSSNFSSSSYRTFQYENIFTKSGKNKLKPQTLLCLGCISALLRLPLSLIK